MIYGYPSPWSAHVICPRDLLPLFSYLHCRSILFYKSLIEGYVKGQYAAEADPYRTAGVWPLASCLKNHPTKMNNTCWALLV